MKEKEILEGIRKRLGIEELNGMQQEMLSRSSEGRDIILLSPTGSGKTLAFTLPVMKLLKPSTGRIQCVVVAPSRELVIQIAAVMREAGKAFRVVALYGGHKVEDEVNSLKVTPDIVVATPGRLLDHSVRHNLELLPVRLLVLDEFDKTLELGFEEEMEKLMKRMKNVSRIILTSATNADILPEFLKLDNPLTIDFSSEAEEVRARMNIRKVSSDNPDKLESLLTLLHNINSPGLESGLKGEGEKEKKEKEIAGNGPEKAIIFVNHRESAERVYEFLKKRRVACVLYHGALEQKDREMAVALFNNGSRPILVATDLAARGLDIERVKAVVHYHQPLTPEAFTHRNGRTARVDEVGDVYLLLGPEEELKEFVSPDGTFDLDETKKGDLSQKLMTIYVSGGKREKLSKGDILGFLIKECGLESSDIGKIDVFDHYSLVAVREGIVPKLLNIAEGKKLKGEKRKFRPLD
ncbi:MAG: DEAD/DEAH box helicase [Muribaculaceae bacterium]|nr:DEAD/DEAH box helicase [Muribaculaceae bacterium]